MHCSYIQYLGIRPLHTEPRRSRLLKPQQVQIAQLVSTDGQVWPPCWPDERWPLEKHLKRKGMPIDSAIVTHSTFRQLCLLGPLHTHIGPLVAITGETREILPVNIIFHFLHRLLSVLNCARLLVLTTFAEETKNSFHSRCCNHCAKAYSHLVQLHLFELWLIKSPNSCSF